MKTHIALLVVVVFGGCSSCSKNTPPQTQIIQASSAPKPDPAIELASVMADMTVYFDRTYRLYDRDSAVNMAEGCDRHAEALRAWLAKTNYMHPLAAPARDLLMKLEWHSQDCRGPHDASRLYLNSLEEQWLELGPKVKSVYEFALLAAK